MITDPYYEPGAVHLGAFVADRLLLGSFLAGYGGASNPPLSGVLFRGALMHEFDLFGGAVGVLAEQVDSLEELAERLCQPR